MIIKSLRGNSVLRCIKSFFLRIKMYKVHKSRITIKFPSGREKRKKPMFYIIRFDDPMYCGWTTWERVALYGCIYAEDHGMIPVMDMQNCPNIYLENEDLGKINAWDKYYYQPCNVALDKAMESESYELSDPSQDWYYYVRYRKPDLHNDDYLRAKYQKYIHLNEETLNILETNYQNLFFKNEDRSHEKALGFCMRGTDYKQFHHPKQPLMEVFKPLIKNTMERYHLDTIFVATEDGNILRNIRETFSEYSIISYKAGEFDDNEGVYIAEVIRRHKTADEAAIDYLSILYMLDKCKCLVAGRCGASIGALHKKYPPYEYVNVIDLNEAY